jgi:hypothetical protein
MAVNAIAVWGKERGLGWDGLGKNGRGMLCRQVEVMGGNCFRAGWGVKEVILEVDAEGVFLKELVV